MLRPGAREESTEQGGREEAGQRPNAALSGSSGVALGADSGVRGVGSSEVINIKSKTKHTQTYKKRLCGYSEWTRIVIRRVMLHKGFWVWVLMVFSAKLGTEIFKSLKMDTEILSHGARRKSQTQGSQLPQSLNAQVCLLAS